jgi:hypothetical protein
MTARLANRCRPLDAIAVELGVSETQVRRDLASALEKLRAVDPDIDPDILCAVLTIPRRFSDESREHRPHAARAADNPGISPPPLSWVGVGERRRVRPPSRFGARTPR